MTERPDLVYGIDTGGGVQTVAQWFALIAGAAYAAVGVIGFFITGFDNFTEVSGEQLFWIFAINPFHNVVHIGVGAVWLLAAFLLSSEATEGALFAVGGFYVLAAILGYLGYLNLIGITNPLDPVNFFHLISGVLAVLFSGLLGASSVSRRKVTADSR